MTGQMMEKIEEVALKEQPDWVLVYGDTNSTLAGALVASKLHIKLAHIEAGLRSFNMQMPEEINRILTDRVSQILFCPTQTAVDNLSKEGYDNFDTQIHQVGDIMYDGALYYKGIAEPPKDIKLQDDYILATIHRQENTDSKERLTNIVEALNHITKDKQVVLPLHPRTKKLLSEYDLILDCTLIEPLGYLQMVYLLNHCNMVMTDSGGLQKEAYFFEKPCITLRDETEWVELVDNNYNVLVGADKDKIVRALDYTFATNYQDTKLYGDGNTAANIINKLYLIK